MTRQWVAHPGSVAIVAHDGERVWLVRQPREAIGEPDLLELPAGKLDEEGESPLECGQRELAEEIGKAAEHWEHLTTYCTSAGFTDEQCHIYPRDRPARRAGAGDRGRAHRRRGASAGRARRDDRRVPRRQDVDRTAADAEPARHRVNGVLREAGPARAAAKPLPPWPLRRRPPRRSRSSTCCSTSSPTSSSSAGSRATRSRRTAPTCSSSATGSAAPAATRSTVGHAELSAFADEIASGHDDKPPAAPATLQRKVACLRSFYRHLRRTAVLTTDPTAYLRAPKQSRKLPQVLSRDEVAELLRQPRGTDAGGAARPRAAGDDVRMRPARVGGDRAGGRRRRSRGRHPARPRQGLEGAPGADRLGRGHGADRLRAARPRAARRRPLGGTPVRQPARRRPHPPGALQDRPAARRERRPGGEDEPAHAAPHVRHAPARRRLRPALAAGDARPRRHRDHPAVHAPLRRAAQGRLLRRPSPRAWS